MGTPRCISPYHHPSRELHLPYLQTPENRPHPLHQYLQQKRKSLETHDWFNSPTHNPTS